MEDIFGRPVLRTYSRGCKTRQAKMNKMNDVLFTEKAFKSNKWNSSFVSNTSNESEPSISKASKTKPAPKKRNLDGTPSLGTLKKNKQSRSKASKPKGKKSPKRKKYSPVMSDIMYESLLCETLHGEIVKLDGNMKQNSNGPSRNTQKTQAAVEDPAKKRSLPEQEMGVQDKVSAWFAHSITCSPGVSDSSIEVMRGEENISGHERRKKLFPDEFYENLHTIIPPGYKTKAPLDKNKAQEEQKSFLAQLRLQGPGTTRRSIPNQSSVTGTTTGYTADFENGTKTGTGLSQYTTDVPTGTSQYTDIHTGTTTSQHTTDVPTDTTDVPTSTSKYTTDIQTGTSHFTTENEPDSQVTSNSQSGGRTSRFTTETVGDTKDNYTDDIKDSSRRSNIADPAKMKYLSSTMKKGLLMSPLEFPSEMSTITDTDSMNKKRRQEQTPKRTPVFKMPGSPSKSQGSKGQRRGNLQPKNSTRLFTTGFVEIVDIIPQMSTILFDQDLRSTRKEVEATSPTFGAVVDDHNPHVHLPIKTSTPNKLEKQGDFEFEIDISSVNMDSDDDQGLQFNQSSREINSEEIINLSTTLIDLKEGQILAKNVEDSCEGEVKSIQSPKVKSRRLASVKSTYIDPATSQGIKTKKKKSQKIKKSAEDIKQREPGIKKSAKVSDDIEKDHAYDVDISERVKRPKKSKLTNSTAKGKLKNARKTIKTVSSHKNNKVSRQKQTISHTNSIEIPTFSADPKKVLLFSKISNSTSHRSLSNLFHLKSTQESLLQLNSALDTSSKKYKVDKENSAANDLDNSSYSLKNKKLSPKTGKMASKMCSLMNEDFACPRLDVCLCQYVEQNCRNYQEIINGVPSDTLL